MITRIRHKKLVELHRRDLPAPVDVINLISTARFDRYRWYGLLVLPLMLAVGARVEWMGRFHRSVHGAQQADKLLIVRYPSHRRFLAMTVNPYYLAINRLREAGVRRFEAAFTHASYSDPELRRRKLLVAVHCGLDEGAERLPAIIEAMSVAGGELVYATRSIASLDFLVPPRPTDPQPLRYGGLALFACEDEQRLAGHDLAAEVAAAAGDCSVQVYRREARSAYRPFLRPTGVEAA